MDSEFSIKTEPRPHNVSSVMVSGRLDAQHAGKLMEHCQALRDQGCRTLIINLSQVSFVASSGVGTLLALTEEMKDVDGDLYLVSLSETVSSVLRLLKLSKFMSIAPSEADVLATLSH
ncbi:MAG: hypothetical protein DHS20C21_21590 [Gemmatimonadota bacterium]|nr:MAG: hypothetical protein DHS20C21_21590 [Gemmatimonadota bacterium]